MTTPDFMEQQADAKLWLIIAEGARAAKGK
jgi:hypothetical protein